MAFSKKKHKNISIHDLILLGIYLVIKKGETCTFERLVAECFNRFPKIFGFKRYPHWPDSLKFDRPLRTLREKGLIVGTSTSEFNLTEFGKQKAIRIAKKLKKGRFTPEAKREGGIRSIDDRLIEYIKNSEYYRKFLRNPEELSISEPGFRELLRCTMETPLRVVKQNLEYLKKLSQSYNEPQIGSFLRYCEKIIFKKDG